MSLCVFEDRQVWNLEPLTLTRPAFDLVCGIGALLERQQRVFAAGEAGVVVRPLLAPVCRFHHPQLPVNDADWLRSTPKVLVNARWLPPPEPCPDLTTPRVGCIGEEVAYTILPGAGVADWTFERTDELVAEWKQTLPRCDAGGTLLA